MHRHLNSVLDLIDHDHTNRMVQADDFHLRHERTGRQPALFGSKAKILRTNRTVYRCNDAVCQCFHRAVGRALDKQMQDLLFVERLAVVFAVGHALRNKGQAPPDRRALANAGNAQNRTALRLGCEAGNALLPQPLLEHAFIILPLGQHLGLRVALEALPLVLACVTPVRALFESLTGHAITSDANII